MSTSLAIIAQRTGSRIATGEHHGYTHRLLVAGSSGNEYVVSMRISDKVWCCGCRGWIGNRRCKHLDRMLPTLISAVPGSKASDPIAKKSLGATPRVAIGDGEATDLTKVRNSRLPPGEAERRAKERARATWSGEKYNKVEPGSAEDWAAQAAAFASGDFIKEARTFKAKSSTRKSSNPYLATLNLDDMPLDFNGLRRGYRAAVMTAFRAANFSDTAPAYVTAFKEITRAYDRLKAQSGW